MTSATEVVDDFPVASFTSVSTDIPMGSIMTAVAVFDTHMDKNAVAIMNPAIIAPGLLGMIRKTPNAIRLCRFHRCMASAIKNPPMNRKIVAFPYEAPTWLNVRGLGSAPSEAMGCAKSGNATSGTNAVAAVSYTHLTLPTTPYV